jgi:hypothetical protein
MEAVVDQNWLSPRQSRKKGSAEDFLRVIAINCDYEGGTR